MDLYFNIYNQTYNEVSNFIHTHTYNGIVDNNTERCTICHEYDSDENLIQICTRCVYKYHPYCL